MSPWLIPPILTALCVLALTWGNENLRAWKRRRQVASAFVLELRTYRRHLERLLTAAEKRDYIRDIGFSRHLYETLLGELPFLGSDRFLAVRATYQQLAAVNYLLAQFEIPDTGLGEADRRQGIADALVPASRMAITRIDEALTTLRGAAPSNVFDVPLPAVTEFSERERALFSAGGQ